MFKPVSPKPNVPQMEDALVRFWKTWHIAEKCEEQRWGGVEFVYYEKPPSPHSKPGLPLAVTRAFSDLFLRYKAMRGYHILRRSGWQAHGLPVELMAAKQLGLTGKNQIEEFGLVKYNQHCRVSLDYYAPYWERMNDHLGYWVDPRDAYVTFTNEYIESVWWAVKSLWDKGLLYQALKVLSYCPSCGVHLSNHEIWQGNEEISEPSICVRLPLVNGPGTSLLVLTNAPWTLVGNVAVAVNPEAEYITIEQESPGGGIEHLVVARKSAEKIFGEMPLKIVDKFKGRKLKGEAYFPLYKFILPQKSAHYVLVDDFVSEEIGSGLMPVAPIFNEHDLHTAQEYDLPLLNPITDAGAFIPDVRPWSGKFVKDADPFIIQDLDARGLLFKAESHSHAQPHCLYCGSPLLDYARNTWFIRINQYQDQLLKLSQQSDGYSDPHQEEIKKKQESVRFTDRAFGYDRFWGTPLPIWECQACHHQVCVGSINELAELAGKNRIDLDLHRPYLDEISLKCPECQGLLIRVPELVHPWFDTSCMPFSRWHYPFENQTVFEKQFPADLVCGPVDQTDDWLTDLQAINGILFEKIGFKSTVNLRSLLVDQAHANATGQTKDVEPLEVINQIGADIFRWHLFECWQPFEGQHTSPVLLTESAIKTAQRTIFLLWNVYSFFVTQANPNDWSPVDLTKKPYLTILDKWLRSELHTLTRDVTVAYETYDARNVVSLLKIFIEKLSRWYIRQSRPRFSKRKMDADKAAAYATLYETLITLCKLCAPVTPFLAEEMYQNLSANSASQSPVSVHLSDWPISDLEAMDESLVLDMEEIMKLASLGRAARNKANIPLHQPLAEIAFLTRLDPEPHRIASCAGILKNALNVKQVKFLDSSSQAEQFQHAHSENVVVSQGTYLAVLVTQRTSELMDEGAARQVIHRVNALRKQAGLAMTDHIRLYIKATPVLLEAIFRYRQAILNEALADEISEGSLPARGSLSKFEINGESIIIGIEKL